MADGVTITAGTGTTVATDDCGASGHAQIVKLGISTDGSATAIPADATYGLDVDVKAVPAPLSSTGGGTEAAALRVTIATDSTGVLSVDDNSSTLSIDDGGGNISIDDGGNTITVDGTVTATVQPLRKTGAWSLCHEETGAITNHELKAAPAGGTALYIVSVVWNSAIAGTLKLLDGSGGTVLIGLPGIAANGGASMFFGVETAIKLTDATALCGTSTGAGNHTITITGYTA